MKTNRTVPGWYSARDAAAVLGKSPSALRKMFERAARRTRDGGIEAQIDGVRARKFGNHWRVSFSEAWTQST